MTSSRASSAVRAVVFDLDDTLLDHGGSVRRALAGWLPTLGAAADPALIQTWFDLEGRHFESWRSGLVGFDEQRRRRLRDFLPLVARAVGSDRELDAVFNGYVHWYEKSWRAFDDVRSALEGLAAQQLVVAVLSNGATPQQNRKVEAIGVRADLAAVCTSEELGVAKPAPRAYLAVCEQIGVDPARVVHVGDRHDIDVVAAREAGLEALHLDRHHELAEPPAGRISTLLELPGRLI